MKYVLVVGVNIGVPGVVVVTPVQGAEKESRGTCCDEGGVVGTATGRGSGECGLNMVSVLTRYCGKPALQELVGAQKNLAVDIDRPACAVVRLGGGRPARRHFT